jgi:hypothetical protein
MGIVGAQNLGTSGLTATTASVLIDVAQGSKDKVTSSVTGVLGIGTLAVLAHDAGHAPENAFGGAVAVTVGGAIVIQHRHERDAMYWAGVFLILVGISVMMWGTQYRLPQVASLIAIASSFVARTDTWLADVSGAVGWGFASFLAVVP